MRTKRGLLKELEVIRAKLGNTQQQLYITRAGFWARDASLWRANRKINNLFADVKQLRACLDAGIGDGLGDAALSTILPVEFGGTYEYHDSDVRRCAGK